MAYALKTTKIPSHLLFQMRIFFPPAMRVLYTRSFIPVYSFFFFFQEKNRRLNENDPRYWLVIFDDIAEGRVKVPFLPWLIACLNFFIIISLKYFHFNCKYKLLLYDKIFTCFEVDPYLIFSIEGNLKYNWLTILYFNPIKILKYC